MNKLANILGDLIEIQYFDIGKNSYDFESIIRLLCDQIAMKN